MASIHSQDNSKRTPLSWSIIVKDTHKRTGPRREHLTLEEVKQLAATSCRFPILKRAFLFSCLTILRKSDIQKLIWSEVQKFGDFTRIIFNRRKQVDKNIWT
ncbi:hypothetical protein HMPREF1199_00355 [Hoylesella oralis CC98A]|nr:hypothetical protein [Prevotella phocaeensis]ETD21287.1 hypothetical protein HMPREF1199_00355 [Hoylesella oralis CC98A]